MINSKNFSFLIAVYNGEKFIIECLSSIFTQIGIEDEVVICDDCSTDSTLELINNFIKKNNIKNCKLLKNGTNQGISTVRNKLLTNAEGKYIWFIDSDDIVVEDAINNVSDFLKYQDSEIVCCGYYKLQNEELVLKKSKNKKFLDFYKDDYKLKDFLIDTNDNYLWNKVFKSSVIKNINFSERRYFEDIEILTLIANKNPSFIVYEKPVIKYRQHPNSLIQDRQYKYFDDYLDVNLNRYVLWKNTLGKKSQGYVSYKICKNYIKIMDELNQHNQLYILKNLYLKFNSRFEILLNNAVDTIDILRALRLKREWNKIQSNLVKHLND